MEIKVGGVYLTRGGTKVQVIRVSKLKMAYPVSFQSVNGDFAGSCTLNGAYVDFNIKNDWDLMEEVKKPKPKKAAKTKMIMDNLYE